MAKWILKRLLPSKMSAKYMEKKDQTMADVSMQVV